MRGRKLEYPKRKLTTSFRKCHILKPKYSIPNWDLNLLSGIAGRLGKADVLSIIQLTHRPDPALHFVHLRNVDLFVDVCLFCWPLFVAKKFNTWHYENFSTLFFFMVTGKLTSAICLLPVSWTFIPRSLGYINSKSGGLSFPLVFFFFYFFF